MCHLEALHQLACGEFFLDVDNGLRFLAARRGSFLPLFALGRLLGPLGALALQLVERCASCRHPGLQGVGACTMAIMRGAHIALWAVLAACGDDGSNPSGTVNASVGCGMASTLATGTWVQRSIDSGGPRELFVWLPAGYDPSRSR